MCTSCLGYLGVDRWISPGLSKLDVWTTWWWHQPELYETRSRWIYEWLLLYRTAFLCLQTLTTNKIDKIEMNTISPNLCTHVFSYPFNHDKKLIVQELGTHWDWESPESPSKLCTFPQYVRVRIIGIDVFECRRCWEAVYLWWNLDEISKESGKLECCLFL
jgi:hypothetical protein